MMMCSECKKNLAVIFTNKVENGKTVVEGLCIDCARKKGIPMVDELIKQTGMSPEELATMNKHVSGMLEDMDEDEIKEMTESMDRMMPEGMKDNFMQMFNGSMAGSEDEFEKDDEYPDAEFVEVDEKEEPSRKQKRRKRKYLDKFGSNLTLKAKEGFIDRIIGRYDEIDRVVQILNRRNKNNPVLIGEPGVGKTAIAEGLALRIVEKKVPAKLFGAEIYLLDLTAIVAGTQFRGQFESRMKAIIDEAQREENVILVIDELHNIVGAGEAQNGAMNAANILKPALARGDVQIIGSTTLEEYRKHIEKDSALERRFQPVMVEEPSVEDSVEILKGIKDYYERYHKVQIDDNVIEHAVRLSERYITDRYLPDKAIDVIDEAGSRANLKNLGLVELEKLRQEYDEIGDLKAKYAQEDNYEKAAELKVQELKIKDKITKLEQETADVEITKEDIAYVIEAWTKIPVHKITEDEADRLLGLESQLHKRVIGQNDAIKSLAKTIRRNRSGFRRKRKPASFIFVGPTGVGKTELVKTLAAELFGSEEAMIRIDMSEYMEKHTVSKLIGAPPGYVGYDEGGQLTERVRRKPYSVILLDEIEKAHPDVYNMLLQILEDGRLTDSQGRTVFFENTVIVMTSNAGTSYKSSVIGFNKDNESDLKGSVHEALKASFRPEFLNRIDEIIVFDSLKKDELRQIVELMLSEVREEVGESKMKLSYTEEVREWLLEKGFDPKYGARPLRRTIQKYIEDEISELYLKGIYKEGSKINIDVEDNELKFN
ncbi:MAG: ATP-dependent Clp protease ATP-binding subunit [Tissierellales bacterium]|jgi:ATP-dependent Clp protease ATP-binding subunit ClpA|nr:ATP-dependent Clp protease ATP-binding subunit [Tissierellales bacterium]